MTKSPDLSDITTLSGAPVVITANNKLIEDSFENTLSRDGCTPNQMEADIDLNSNDLLNAGVVNASDVFVAGVKLVPASATPDWKSAWVTATSYVKDDLVREDGSSYIAITAHTSGTFSTDLSGGLWELFAQKGSAGAGTGDMLAANNLSDVVSPTSSRANISAASQADLDTVETTADDALPKAGGTMTGAILASLGSAAAASIAFVGDLGTGIYRVSAGILGFSSSGTLAARIDPAGTSAPDATTVMTREKGDNRYRVGQRAVITDEKSLGVAGQTHSANTWTKHDLQTLNDPDSLITSLSSDQFTPAHDCYITAFIKQRDKALLRIWNATDAVISSEGVGIWTTGGTEAVVTVTCEIVAGKAYELQFFHNGALQSAATNAATTEMYAMVEVIRK